MERGREKQIRFFVLLYKHDGSPIRTVKAILYNAHSRLITDEKKGTNIIKHVKSEAIILDL